MKFGTGIDEYGYQFRKDFIATLKIIIMVAILDTTSYMKDYKQLLNTKWIRLTLMYTHTMLCTHTQIKYCTHKVVSKQGIIAH